VSELGLANTSESRVYHSWYNKCTSGPTSTFSKWSDDVWQQLGDGDNLYDALMYTINQQTEFGDNAPVNNYRLKGQGLPVDKKLRSN
jgi:hypothetical protein